MTGRHIEIADLQRPALSEAARKLADKIGTFELSEAAVLSAAQTATGLNDFGLDDFRARLKILVESVNGNSKITRLGRYVAFRTFMNAAVIRLRLTNLLACYPEIHDEAVRDPVIIVGPWRSGTTHLHGLIAADTRIRSLTYREAFDPIPRATELAAVSDRATFQGSRQPGLFWPQLSTEMLPHLAAMHPIGLDDVAEDGLLQAPDFPIGENSNQRSHYEFMVTMLKALQWLRGPKRWVLKLPEYCEQLPMLIKMCPGATFVMTHRDPVASVQSIATRVAYAARLEYENVDTALIGATYADRVERMLRSLIRDRSVVPANQRVDVHFSQLLRDDQTCVNEIYRVAGLQVTGDQLAKVESFKSEHPRHKNGKVEYNLWQDFNMDPFDLRQRFEFYYEAFSVTQESI